MEKFIIYKNKKIFYKIILSNRKSTAIQIKNANIIVKTNKYASLLFIENYILKNIDKIIKILDKQEDLYTNNSIIKFLGKDYLLNIIFTDFYNKKNIHIIENIINIYIPKDELDTKSFISSSIDDLYLETMKAYIPLSLEKFKNLTGLSPKKVSFKKMKTRWGSCSSSGNISLNIFLAKYDKHIIDYVVLHELCHLKEMNHSKKFWDLVNFYMPNYKNFIKLLSSEGTF